MIVHSAPAAALAALALVGLLAGCYPQAKGVELEDQAKDQERRLKALEEGIAQQRSRMSTALSEAEGKVAELQQVLEQATAVVTRNSADLGSEVIQLREQLQTVEGELAELRNDLQGTQRQMGEQQQQLDQEIRRFAQKAGVDMSLDDSQIPSDRSAHYQAGEQALQSGEHSKARALFRAYVERYREDDKADDAQYWVGKSYLQENRPANALGEFRRVISNYRTGDIMDRALFDMADAFYQLHACTDAKSTLQALIQSHPRSSLVREARTKVRSITRAPRGYCTS